ncbi:MAG: hypothetical protein EON98_07195 [Chitinophagaceae bacterium]|nr:MAG: hypothetical protein EON98_07195 [Chitinophagaceae bacterium]
MTLGKFIEAAHPERDFTPQLPPPFKMFEFSYETKRLRATVEVHSLHDGNYYVHIKSRFVHGRPQDGFDQAYFSRRQQGTDKPFWHFTCYWYKELFEQAGKLIDEYEQGQRVSL